MPKATSMLNRSFARKLGLFVCAASIIGTLTGVMRQSWTGANILESEACAQSRFANLKGCTTDPTTGSISCPTFNCQQAMPACKSGSCCNSTLTSEIFCVASKNGVCCNPPGFNGYACKSGQRCTLTGCK
jgi:hypothetical protein